MAVKKLYRIIVRQRVNWAPGVDSSVPESRKPNEIEGYSTERDITDYVEGFNFKSNRGVIATDITLDIINPVGQLTPNNSESPYNRAMVLDHNSATMVDTFTPLLAEGNEVQVFRIAQGNDPTIRANWIPRFRGKIHAVESAVSQGQDSLRVVAGSVLTEMTKKTLVGSFSPIMRTTSQVPANSFYDLATLTSAVGIFRAVSIPQNVPTGFTATSNHYGDPSTMEVGPTGIPASLLAKLFWWDSDDVFFQNGAYLTPGYFTGVSNITTFSITGVPGSTQVNFTDESFEDQAARVAVPVQDTTATAVWNLNGHSWFVEAGATSVTKDVTQVLDDEFGSLKLINATIRFDLTKLPTGTMSLMGFGYRITDASTIRVQILKCSYNRLTYTYGAPTTHSDTTVTGPTLFNAAALGGLLLNTPVDTAYQWQRQSISVPVIPNSTFDADTDTVITIYQVKLTVAGTAWIDNPRLEFTSVTVATNGTAIQLDNNILNLPRSERWTTADGIIYRSPYPQHRVMSKKNNRAMLRTWAVPYGAGTLKGYSPSNLKNRALPESSRYQRELIEGTEYETLYEKGAIQLQGTFRRTEIFVTGTFYDLAYSPHMEAAEMMKRLMIEAGIPATSLSLEATGIIMSKITLGVDTTTSLLKALKDILSQLPQNYHLYEDGNGKVIGRFIQQNGSPRVFNPVVQVPIPQQAGGVIPLNSEQWYGVTALMADGKETMLSNMVSTVPYGDYYDFQHKSIVIAGACPALKIKPVPNMVGLVVRRAASYKTAADSLITPAPKPAYVFPFRSADPVVNLKEDLAAAGKTGTAIGFTDVSAAFTQWKVSEITQTPTTTSNDGSKG
jgi:hypothetical protein